MTKDNDDFGPVMAYAVGEVDMPVESQILHGLGLQKIDGVWDLAECMGDGCVGIAIVRGLCPWCAAEILDREARRGLPRPIP